MIFSKLEAVIGDDSRFVKLYTTSALFKANVDTFILHVIPAYLEGLAVLAEKDGAEYERNLKIAMSHVGYQK